MITGCQVREAFTLLDWTPLTLASRAVLSLDEVARAQDDIAIRRLGGLQLGAVRETFEAAGVEFLKFGKPGVRLRKQRSAVDADGTLEGWATDPDEVDQGRR